MANYVYRLPPDDPPPAPSALQIGLDWERFHLPPFAGGLVDQPIRLMKQIRLALNAYHAIQSYRSAQASLSADSAQRFYSANPELMKFMQYVWSLQDHAS